MSFAPAALRGLRRRKALCMPQRLMKAAFQIQLLSRIKKGVLGISYCKYLHTAVAFMRIVDGTFGTKEVNGFKDHDGKSQPQLNFLTPIGLPNTINRCAFSESVFYASAL